MGDERLINLEARYEWLERHVGEQDRAMAELGEEIRRLRREIEALREELGDAEGPGVEGDAEERPPHY
jgi:SlyX protein